MISDELLNKFNRIENLPISEEMLGAYMEGNLSDSEVSQVMSSINDSTYIADFIDSLGEPQLYENNSENFADDQIDFPDEDFFISTYDAQETETMNGTSYNIYGEAGENIKDPVYIQQPDDHSCALRSQQIVLRDFGIDIPFDKLEEMALSYGVYTEQGTYTYDIGKVLQIAGVDMHQVQGSSFLDLTNELAQGHRVIVSVDANELWYTDLVSKLKNWFDDVIGKQGGNHALIVAGVEVNPQNPNDVKVVLTDPGAGHLRVEYPLDQFMDAWKDSKCFMAATDNPAPYQYDPETGKEIPSNFMVQQFVNDFIASNGYQLSPDMVNVPADYQPAFAGHLDMIGNLDYDTFEANYSEYQESQIPSYLTIAEQIEEQAKISEEQLHALNGNRISASSHWGDNNHSSDEDKDKNPFKGGCEDINSNRLDEDIYDEEDSYNVLDNDVDDDESADSTSGSNSDSYDEDSDEDE